MTLLVTGAHGQLGSELKELFGKSRGNPRGGNGVRHNFKVEIEPDPVSTFFVDRDELDITDPDAVDHFFAEHKPDYCINVAAYTNVEKAEDEYEQAHAVNAQGAENIARACAKHNTTLFHISTDFVFDGKKTVPYTEEDEPHPLSAYARTKYEGELTVQEHCPRSFVVRTSWLYSTHGSNFVKTMIRCMKEMGSGTNSLQKLSQTPFLSIVADQYGSPTYAHDLAEALLDMIDVCEGIRHPERSEGSRGLQNTPGFLVVPPRDDVPYGIYHYADDGEVSWFEFAQKIRDLAGLSCELRPISSSEYPSKVKRPAYSVLSTKKIQAVFGVRVPDWDESLVDFFEGCATMLS